jgi:riboflavin synthase
MFTGLITDIGTIDRVAPTDAGREFRVRSAFTGVTVGESIAVNGVCLTVRERGEGWFAVAAVVSTAGRTTVRDWSAGRRVNLERALVVGDRLGGHMVQGHVDAVGEVTRVETHGDALLVDLLMPVQLMPLTVLHGSICVDGVSLTVNDIPDSQSLQVALIDFTRRNTTLGGSHPGDRVNVEADLIAKHIQRLMAGAPDLANFPSSI